MVIIFIMHDVRWNIFPCTNVSVAVSFFRMDARTPYVKTVAWWVKNRPFFSLAHSFPLLIFFHQLYRNVHFIRTRTYVQYT